MTSRAGHRQHPLEIAPTHPPITEGFPLGEIIGLALHVLEAAEPVRLLNSFRALELEFSEVAVANRANLIPDAACRVGRVLGGVSACATNTPISVGV
jgi:hypothetical protein